MDETYCLSLFPSSHTFISSYIVDHASTSVLWKILSICEFWIDKLQAKQGEPDNTPDDILAMVRQLAAPQYRLLLFLQQSSVEWCSSLWLDVIKSIDPNLQRTIVVVSKFDNRLKVRVILPN